MNQSGGSRITNYHCPDEQAPTVPDVNIPLPLFDKADDDENGVSSSDDHQVIECNDLFDVKGNNAKIRTYNHYSGTVTINTAAPTSKDRNSPPIPAPKVESRTPRYPLVDYNDKVIWSVVKNLSQEQLLRMTTLLRKDIDTGLGIPREQLAGIKTNTDLINCLEDNKLLGVNNTWFLQHLAGLVGNMEIYKDIIMFMVRRMKQEHPVCIYEPHESTGCSSANATLKIHGDVNQFLSIQVETYRQILAENCGNRVTAIRYINLTGSNNGCVQLSFQIPSSCKEALLDQARNNSEWLSSNGIFEVCVDGEEPINLPKDGHQGTSPAEKRVQLLSGIFSGEPEDLTEVPSKDLVNSALGGQPFLHWACELNKTKWVQFLLNNGADAHATDEMDHTILQKVEFLGLPDTYKTLLSTAGMNHFVMDEITPHTASAPNLMMDDEVDATQALPMDEEKDEDHPSEEVMYMQRLICGRMEREQRRREQKENHSMTTDGLTRHYIEDYCMFRLRKNDVELEEYQNVRREPFNDVAARIRQIGEEIENSNPDFFSSCCEQLQNSQSTPYEKFRCLADELFSNQENGQKSVSWGRIAALITLSGNLSLHYVNKQQEMLVPGVIEWTSRYIDDNLRDWLEENQGWAGFMEYFGRDHAHQSEVLRTALRYTAVGLGVVTAALLLRQDTKT